MIRQEEDILVNDDEVLPDEMIIGERSYKSLDIFQGEKSLRGDKFTLRSIKMGASLGEDEARHWLKNQKDIPFQFRRRAIFAFTDWIQPGNFDAFFCIFWDSNRWRGCWKPSSEFCKKYFRVLRPKES